MVRARQPVPVGPLSGRPSARKIDEGLRPHVLRLFADLLFFFEVSSGVKRRTLAGGLVRRFQRPNVVFAAVRRTFGAFCEPLPTPANAAARPLFLGAAVSDGDVAGVNL